MANILSSTIDYDLFVRPGELHLRPEAFLRNLAALLHKQLTVGDSGVPRHILLRWNRLGLLPQSFVRMENWKRFSVIDLCWLRLLQKMDERQVPMALRQKAAQQLLSIDLEAYFDGIVQDSEWGKDPHKAKVLEQVKGMIKYSFEDFSEFTLIFITLLQRSAVLALVVSERAVEVLSWGRQEAIERVNQMPELFSEDFYALNLNELIEELFIGRKTKVELFEATQLISEEELEVIKALRTTGLHEVKVKLSKEGHIVLLSKVKNLEVEKVKRNIRGLSKKGVVKLIDMTYDPDENLRVVVETEQVKFVTNKKEPKTSITSKP